MESHVALPALLDSDRAGSESPPAVLYEAHRRLNAAPNSYRDAEKRCEPRHAMALRAVVVPLNAQGEVSGHAFVCLTNNISASGLSLLHTSAVNELLLEVTLDNAAGDPLHGTLEVLRCRPVGECFEIAGRFVPWSH
jgi:hypothetical protein